jgi:hypothetical protein
MATATRTKTKKGQSELLKGGEFPYRTYPYREERERRGSLPSLPPQTPRPFKVRKGVPYREPPTPLGAEKKRYRDFTMAGPTPPMGTQSLTGSLSDLGAAGGGGPPMRGLESQHPLRHRLSQSYYPGTRTPPALVLRQWLLNLGTPPVKGVEPLRVKKQGKVRGNKQIEGTIGAPPG